ncbi:MAG: hypothetical protein LBT83_00930 [Tannerella sp.]|jgi:hypothetical protein|nr:hypothetical protein [Tannerella sp.]
MKKKLLRLSFLGMSSRFLAQNNPIRPGESKTPDGRLPDTRTCRNGKKVHRAQ